MQIQSSRTKLQITEPIVTMKDTIPLITKKNKETFLEHSLCDKSELATMQDSQGLDLDI